MRHSNVFWKSSDFPLEKTWFANPLLLLGLLPFFGVLLFEAFLPVLPPLLGVHLFLMFLLELQRIMFTTCWANCLSLLFRLHRAARSSTSVFADLLLACCLADTACAVANVVATLTFIILIVSRVHAFFLVVPAAHSSTCSWQLRQFLVSNRRQRCGGMSPLT